MIRAESTPARANKEPEHVERSLSWWEKRISTREQILTERQSSCSASPPASLGFFIFFCRVECPRLFHLFHLRMPTWELTTLLSGSVAQWLMHLLSAVHRILIFPAGKRGKKNQSGESMISKEKQTGSKFKGPVFL